MAKLEADGRAVPRHAVVRIGRRRDLADDAAVLIPPGTRRRRVPPRRLRRRESASPQWQGPANRLPEGCGRRWEYRPTFTARPLGDPDDKGSRTEDRGARATGFRNPATSTRVAIRCSTKSSPMMTSSPGPKPGDGSGISPSRGPPPAGPDQLQWPATILRACAKDAGPAFDVVPAATAPEKACPQDRGRHPPNPAASDPPIRCSESDRLPDDDLRAGPEPPAASAVNPGHQSHDLDPRDNPSGAAVPHRPNVVRVSIHRISGTIAPASGDWPMVRKWRSPPAAGSRAMHRIGGGSSRRRRVGREAARSKTRPLHAVPRTLGNPDRGGTMIGGEPSEIRAQQSIRYLL